MGGKAQEMERASKETRSFVNFFLNFLRYFRRFRFYEF
jgi:hypothetical protein